MKNSQTTSPWTKFLGSESELMNDKYLMYKDNIMFQCENMVSGVAKELMQANPELTSQDANAGAISLVMEQMLALQYEHTPDKQATMVSELMLCLPTLKDFRVDFMQSAVTHNSLKYKLKKCFQKLFKK